MISYAWKGGDKFILLEQTENLAIHYIDSHFN